MTTATIMRPVMRPIMGSVNSSPMKGGVSIFDLMVNGQRLLVNSQQLRVTGNGD